MLCLVCAVQDPMDVTNVQVIVGHDATVFMFVGMDVTNNGMNNPVCAMVSVVVVHLI